MTEARSMPVALGRPALRGEAAASAEEVVAAIYKRVMRRAPDAAGLANYAEALRSGRMRVKEIVRELLRSEEWQRRFVAGRNIEEILFAIYDCVLARAPDREAWNHLLARGPRSDWPTLAEAVLESEEYSRRFGDTTVPGA